MNQITRLSVILLLAGAIGIARAEETAAPDPQQLHQQRIEQLQRELEPHVEAIGKLAQQVQRGEIDVNAYGESIRPHTEAMAEIQKRMQVEALHLQQKQLQELRREMEAQQQRENADAPSDPMSTEALVQKYHAAVMQHALWQNELMVRRQLDQISEEEFEAAMAGTRELQERQEEVAPHLERLFREQHRQMLAAAGMGVEEPAEDPQKLAESRAAVLRAIKELKQGTDTEKKDDR